MNDESQQILATSSSRKTDSSCITRVQEQKQEDSDFKNFQNVNRRTIEVGIVGSDNNNNYKLLHFLNLDFEMIQDIQSRQILHWNYRNLSQIPPEILLTEAGQNVKEFYLKRNCLVALPSSIGKLSSLTNLYLSGNQLTKLPDELDQLKNLRVLDVSQNDIKQIPGSIGNLQHLEQLILTQNSITYLPKELGNCSNLTTIEASSNQLKFLSEELIHGLIDSLEELGLDQNPLEYLPRNISNVKKLQYLSVCHCHLKYLPSIPFYLIENYWNEKRVACNNDYHPWKSQIEFDGEAPKIFFHFDANPKLNHVPFWILQVWGVDFETFGCARPDVDQTSLLNLAKQTKCFGTCQYNGRRYEIQFDEDIEVIHSVTTRKPTSLVEECLHRAYVPSTSQDSRTPTTATEPVQAATNSKLYLSPKLNISSTLINELPFSLKRTFALGPIMQCFLCKGPIYTQVWVLLFAIPFSSFENQNLVHNVNNHPANMVRGGRIPFSTFTFCSTKCINIFCQDAVTSSNINLGVRGFDSLKLQNLIVVE